MSGSRSSSRPTPVAVKLLALAPGLVRGREDLAAVDIANLALSPAVNNPTTAVQILDHLGEPSAERATLRGSAAGD